MSRFGSHSICHFYYSFWIHGQTLNIPCCKILNCRNRNGIQIAIVAIQMRTLIVYRFFRLVQIRFICSTTEILRKWKKNNHFMGFAGFYSWIDPDTHTHSQINDNVMPFLILFTCQLIKAKPKTEMESNPRTHENKNTKTIKPKDFESKTRKSHRKNPRERQIEKRSFRSGPIMKLNRKKCCLCTVCGVFRPPSPHTPPHWCLNWHNDDDEKTKNKFQK